MADPTVVTVSGTLMKGPICDPVAGTGKSHGTVTITSYGDPDNAPQLRHIVVDASTKKTGKKKLLHVYLRQVAPGSPTDTLIGWAWSNKKGKAVVHLDYALNTSEIETPYELQVLFSKPSTDDCPGTNPTANKTEVMELQVQ